MRTAGLMEMSLEDILDNVEATVDNEDEILRTELFEARTKLYNGGDVILSQSDERALERAHLHSMVTSTQTEEELVFAIMYEEFDEIMRC